MKILKKLNFLSFALIIAIFFAIFSPTKIAARNGEEGDTKVQPVLAFDFTEDELNAANGGGFAPTIGDKKYTLKFRDHYSPTGHVLDHYSFIEGGGIDFRQSTTTWNNSERLALAMDLNSDIYDDINKDFTISMDILCDNMASDVWGTIYGPIANCSSYFGFIAGTASSPRVALTGTCWDSTEYATKSAGSNSGVQETGWVDGEFNHVVISVNPSNGRLKSWCNGVLTIDIAIDSTYTVADASCSFSIGCTYNGGAGYYSSGAIKNLEFYDFALDTEKLEWAFNERGYIWTTDLGEQKEVDPMAKYEFNDAENIGKDSVGSYDLEVLGSGVSVSSGKAILDGNGALASPYSNDLAESIGQNDFTMVYTGKFVSGSGFLFSALSDCWGGGQGVAIGTNSNVYRAACSDSTGYLTYIKENNDWGEIIEDDMSKEHVIAIVKDSTSVKFYSDGVLKQEYAIATMNLSGVTRFTIGGQDWNSLNYKTAQEVEEFRVYDFALNASQVAELAELGEIYETAKSKVASVAELDWSEKIIVPSDASDKEILAYAPAAHTIEVTMSSGVKTNATVTWDAVVKNENTIKLEGTITGVANDDNVKAYALISTKADCLTIKPVAQYSFSSLENILVDETGRFPLELFKRKVQVEDAWVDCDNAQVKVENGAVVFDGNYSLINKDLGKYLGSTATITFDIELTGTSNDWSTPLGFGQNGWTATSFARFQFSSGSNLLRLSIGNTDENTGYSTIGGMTGDGYWGAEIKTLDASKYTITLVLNDDGNVKVYVDSELIYDKPQNGFTLDFSDSIFSIGGVYNYGQFINNCKVSKVSVYDIALTAEMVKVLNANGAIKDNQYTGEYVTSIGTELAYEGTDILTGSARSENTDDEILALAKAATVVATFSNESTKNLSVEWISVDRENGRLVGTIKLSNDDHNVYACSGSLVYAPFTFEAKKNITISECQNGTITSDKLSAYVGDTITLTITPATGYELEGVKVNNVAIEANAQGIYSFELEEDSTITATFKETQKQEDPTDPDPQDKTTETKSQDKTTGTEPTKSGCKGGAIVSIFGSITLVGALLYLKKRKETK